MIHDLTCLVCPKTKEKLYIEKNKEFLVSEISKIKYPIINGIPYFVSILSFGEKETQRVFSAEWNDFSSYDADNLERMSEPIPKNFFMDKNILEVGCGSGRHSSRLIKIYKAKSVCAIDLSDAVQAARINNQELKNLTIANCSVFNLPFKDNYFDLAFSLGVLMHTENPEDAFYQMSSKVKKNGDIIIWVYKKNTRKILMEIPRFFTKNAPTIIQKIISFILSVVFWPFVLLSKFTGLGFSHFREYAKYDYYTYRTDWFDRISAPLIAFFTENEINDWLNRAGYKDRNVSSYGDFFIIGIGRNKTENK
jgi:SAM-dependent methyltransferase